MSDVYTAGQIFQTLGPTHGQGHQKIRNTFGYLKPEIDDTENPSQSKTRSLRSVFNERQTRFGRLSQVMPILPDKSVLTVSHQKS